MRSIRRSSTLAVLCGCAAVALIGISQAGAAQFVDSIGSVTLIGNDSGSASGSFRLQVDYSVYDGQDVSDPLGITADYQVVFQLTHLGDDGELPALNVGRFIVFGEDEFDPTPFYSSITSIADVGTQAPSLMDIDPPPVGPNRAEFFFQTGLAAPNFAPGAVSDFLVLTTTPENLRADVVIEADFTDPGVHADTTITLIPEPTSAALLAMGVFGLIRRRGR